MKKIICLFAVVCAIIGVVGFVPTVKAYSMYESGIMDKTQVRASHLLVDTEAEALKIKADIEAGNITFENAAAQFSKCPSGSRGGDLGFFGKGQMVRPFEDAAFSLPVGVVSEPVQTQFGYHLIKVTDAK